MNVSPITLNKLSLFSLSRAIGHHFILFDIAFAVLLILAVSTIPNSAVAQQEFELIGTWQQTDKDGIQTVTFDRNGTFFAQWDFPPGPGGTGSGRAQWQGKYRATGPSSWAAQVRVFQSCATGGGCMSCPPSLVNSRGVMGAGSPNTTG